MLPESPRYVVQYLHCHSDFLDVRVRLSCHRWLIDTDKDDEGLRVIADLHGGDLDNTIARAEYREIKDKVILEVRRFFLLLPLISTRTVFYDRENQAKVDPIE